MKLIWEIFKKESKSKRQNPIDRQQQALFRLGREQFLRLRDKGLSIPIFTL